MYIYISLCVCYIVCEVYIYSFQRYGIAVSDAEFGRGVGPNYISKVNCVGDETDLLTCPFEKLSCSHENDAGVICGRFFFCMMYLFKEQI